MSNKILVLGDSHTRAIGRACHRRRKSASVEHPASVECSAYMFMSAKSGKQIGDLGFEAAIEMVSALGAKDLVASTLGGNQYAVLGLIQHPVPFDVFEPGVESGALRTGDQCIPSSLLRDVFEQGLRSKIGVRLEKLRSAARCRVVHLAPPPPKDDDAHILRRPETEFARLGILDKGLSPAPLRLKLWRLQQRVMQDLCAVLDVGFLPVPEQAQTADGFLKPEYYAEDATHANVDYGELVLEQLERFVAGEASH